MYYIYHIVGVKIGCTKNPQRRTKQQGFSSYEILETYDCIDRASQRELELQKQYGYKVDNTPYYQSYGNRVKHASKGGRTAGNKTFKNKTGIFKYTLEERNKFREKGVIKSTQVLSKTVMQYTKDDVFVKEYYSVNEATRQTGIATSNIVNVCNKVYRYKTAGGYKWKYKDSNL